MAKEIIQYNGEYVSRDWLKHELKKIISEYPMRWSTRIRRTPGLLEVIKLYTPLLNNGDYEYSLPTMVYWILNDVDSFPIYTCPVDGKQKVLSHVNVSTLAIGYSHLLNSPGCCPRCIKLNPEVKRKCEETSMKNHGVPHFNNAA